MYISNTNIKVRYAETDRMGIVHHSNYYVWFEEARGDFIEKINITYKEVEDMGIMMPIMETHCKYMRASKYGDIIEIKTSIKELTPVKILFDYRVINKKSGELLAKGGTTQTFINNDFKIINMEKKYPEIWKKFQTLQ
ncbi:acyl-CoA thioester hydrolase [Clostridium algifaecis]|uniref:Acyl-CoA thioester hydrolase n=1 Tax=Clostridium algifaecis TaxID=1472040 RepID=A0ABS4KQG0_9CLOT|nr:thioesterase family protein [Clostridium algifaecis]MBP2031706.1 acyl-CoA thioester hydrolase [Clostridium algifaecis]